MENNPSLLQQAGNWVRESLTLKLFTIGFLVLLLLIPGVWLQEVINDRQYYATEATADITSKWSGGQTLAGPVLEIPYRVQLSTKEPEAAAQAAWHTQYLYVLPQTAQVQSNLLPQELNRGIFEVLVYTAKVKLDAEFTLPDWQAMGVPPENIHWQDARLLVGISDVRGMAAKPLVQSAGHGLPTEAFQWHDRGYDHPFQQGLQAGVSLKPGDTALQVHIEVDLKGSESFFLLPTGLNSDIRLGGNWPHPSFDGYFLPDTREVADSTFAASWQLLPFNRPLPGIYKGNLDITSDQKVGVQLLAGVNDYQKTIRTAKYSTLIILFTFLALFITEIISKVRIHPFQYILIGAALVIDYTLLLSLTEHLGFNPAYLLSSLATMLLIALYARSFLQLKVCGLLFTLLGLFYGFIFTITNLQDLSLLIGSIGLFMAIAVLMYLTRRVNWYGNR